MLEIAQSSLFSSFLSSHSFDHFSSNERDLLKPTVLPLTMERNTFFQLGNFLFSFKSFRFTDLLLFEFSNIMKRNPSANFQENVFRLELCVFKFREWGRIYFSLGDLKPQSYSYHRNLCVDPVLGGRFIQYISSEEEINRI